MRRPRERFAVRLDFPEAMLRICPGYRLHISKDDRCKKACSLSRLFEFGR